MRQELVKLISAASNHHYVMRITGDDNEDKVQLADDGVQNIEDAKVLELPPFDQFGSKTQIRRGILGSVEQYTQAYTSLKSALRRT